MRASLFLTISILFVGIHHITSYKVLCIFPFASRSHYHLGSSLLKKLALEGHDVTMIAPFTEKEKLPNYNEVLIDGFEKLMNDRTSNLLDRDAMPAWMTMFMLYGFGEMVGNFTMTHPNVKKLLKSDAKFDVVIVEIFASEALIGFGQHYDAPVIGVGAFGSSSWLNNIIGTPSPPSIIPHPFLSYTDRMTFFQRIHNLFIAVIDYLLLNFYHYPIQKRIYDVGFPDPKPDFYHELRHGVSFAFLNQHFSIAYPKPYAPNMVEVGGLQINRKPKALPADIQAYLDSATDGAVYFSMGSNIESKTMAVHTRDAILRTFKKFPKVKFLWKWEDPELPGKPENLFVQKWFPQDELLAHPNIRLFITHGGLLSTTESIYHGVPVIGIPVFGDQDLNMARAASSGYGLTIKYRNLTEESLTWALSDILSTKKYKVHAMEVSKRYRDQPMEPLDLMTYWVEYIARHKGAPFMQSAAQDLNFWQYHMLDVAAFLIAVLVVVFLVVRKVFRAICCGGKQQGDKKKQE